MPISVACGCGARLKTKDENAGRSLTCPKCGNPIRVPSANAAAPAAAAPERRPPKKPEPAPADIYGLEDLPAPAASTPADDTFQSSRGAASGEEKLPSRAAYAPMTDAKKKKIAKRAKKIDKEKPSFAGAGIGVSLGSVVFIALFGWRLYRITTGVGRVMKHVNASADAEPSDKAIAAEVARATEQMVNDPSTVEAREWLDAAKYPKHVVFEMGNDRARVMVAGFYERGAERVYVLEPEKDGDTEVTALFAVKLPTDPAKRKECFAFAAPYLEAAEPIKDDGEKYLMIPTD